MAFLISMAYFQSTGHDIEAGHGEGMTNNISPKRNMGI
jgi:hypothetical protein